MTISLISCDDTGDEGNYLDSSATTELGLPSSVGTNELAGKKISGWEFYSDMTAKGFGDNYTYSYDSTKKLVYVLYSKEYATGRRQIGNITSGAAERS